MQTFKKCLINSGLGPVRTGGDTFTWTNKRLLAHVLKRLDRIVANASLFNLFTKGNAYVKSRGIMDHNPIVNKEPMQLRRFGKPFQFFNFMIDIPGFLDMVTKAWTVQCHGSPIAQFNAKIKSTN